MTSVVPHWSWLPWRRPQLEPSPIPQAAAQTRRIADEVSRVVDELRRMNDNREGQVGP